MKRSHENPSLDNNETGSTSPKSDEDGFLSRWSRRKRDAEVLEQEVPDSLVAEAPDQQMLSPPQDNASLQTDEAQEGLSEPALTDADMPDVETLNADSDFSPFFSEGVSKELRNLALKKLFFSGKFSARDGLDDYDDDFTKFEPLGDTVTSDMKFHARRKEKARLAELEEQRLLEESEEPAATENANEVAETDSTADENTIPEESEQEPVESCEPERVANEHSEQSTVVENVDEKAERVALEDTDSTVRTPEG